MEKETQYPNKKNFFVTGAPSSGKTTVIKKIIQMLTIPAQGFYTEEERIGNKRVGFRMHSLDGKSGYLAHQDISSAFHIRRYGVSIPNIETIAVPAIIPNSKPIIILDEIGKMECYSDKFVAAAKQALDSHFIVIGTITLGGSDFILEVKQRSDIEILEVTLENRDHLPDLIVQMVMDKILALNSCCQIETLALKESEKRALEAYRGGYISLEKLAQIMGLHPLKLRKWLQEHDIS
jgi:nucleoside-triphosphatase